VDLTGTGEATLVVCGERVGFGPIRRDLIPTYARWLSDLRITRTLAAPCKPMTIEREQAWFDGAVASGDVVFTIYELATLRPIGNVGLHDLDEVLGTAEFGMFIAEPNLWNQGLGTEVTRLMLAYAFDVLGLYNVYLGTYSVNPAAIRAYEKAGFRLIGVRRGAMRVGRQRCDIVYMDAIADDFPPSELAAVMHPPSERPAT
jgi:RimJ/RimL family protein N-acetyltransferase